MRTLIFATHNENKVNEIKSLTNGSWAIQSLTELGLMDDIPEPYSLLETNALQKSSTVFKRTGQNCFSEDTGLEVFALNNAPGVHSARYAGPQRNPEDNINLLLKNLQGEKRREAQFRTIISFIYEGVERQFEGICPGRITLERKGSSGFGYDPIFIPEGDTKTFAEMSLEEKSRYSHRAKAFKKFIAFLQEEF